MIFALYNGMYKNIKALFITFLIVLGTQVLAQDSCADLYAKLLVPIDKRVLNPAQHSSDQSYTYQTQRHLKFLEDQGHTPYRVNDLGDLKNIQDARFIINDHGLAKNPVTYRFVDTLESERENLLEIYNLSNREYFELTRIAVGILEIESRFGRSPKYYIKEIFPSLVQTLKKILNKPMSPNSRGLTQIKVMPEQIAKHYGYQVDQLNDPKISAIATMGFLAQSLPELHAKIARFNVTSVTTENYFDHLLYIYNGRPSQLINNTATPDTNLYIRAVNKRKPSLTIYYKSID